MKPPSCLTSTTPADRWRPRLTCRRRTTVQYESCGDSAVISHKFSGKWYRVGLAYDSPGFIPYRERFKISMGTVDPQPGGNVSMTMWSIGSSGCRSTVYFYEKTSLPGMFTYFSTRHNMVKDITVVDTNYTDYAIVFKYKKMDKEYSQVALYGRNQKLKPELLKKFKDFSLAHGFPRESILTPTKAENCSSPGK